MVIRASSKPGDGLAELPRAALAGLTVTVEQEFTEGDYVATHYTLRGRHEQSMAEGVSALPMKLVMSAARRESVISDR